MPYEISCFDRNQGMEENKLTLLDDCNEDVVASTPIIKESMTVPRRIVMIRNRQGFVVFTQTFETSDSGEIKFYHSEGQYINSSTFESFGECMKNAYAKFADRSMNFMNPVD